MSKKSGTRHGQSILDVEAWRVFTNDEMRAWLDQLKDRARQELVSRRNVSVLVIRHQLSPVDVYCYLKARFGNPNGFQTFLAKDDSDNWIHWDYHIKAGETDVLIAGAAREIHFTISAKLTDQDWKSLILRMKADYRRVGKEKSAVLKSLEKWVIFQNKFVEIAGICSHKHSFIKDYLNDKPKYETFRPTRKGSVDVYAKRMSDASKRQSDMARNALELSLLTPVMAEAYINMVILILCKKSIRDNTRQFEAFIRENIDIKIFNLPFMCDGFARNIDQNTELYKNFKKVMDKRNHVIHGNIDPIKGQTEIVYFEGKRPLYKEAGDHIGKFIETLERQSQPEVIVKDYEDTHVFLLEIASCLEPKLKDGFWRVMEDSYPGYDLNRNITGALFSDVVFTGGMQGLRYDDDLVVSWTE